ncbi:MULTISPECIES: flagellar basal body rod protein FlgB [Aurantimonas]|uniref:flagellar basal body rod protein FlgB n=1 Tax=Aurantimonas TaxID=182269 RepID=UPI001E293838|nr:flagellar basal body rod protein FlgB [Aurantimonas coralicida]MCD1641501.1 flagellar basal body rod protein FlgB [Aurantimonas coralicida]
MDSLYIFGLASQRTAYLAQRQTVVAENVANVDTPGYTSKDLSSFTEALDATALRMSRSQAMHLASMDSAGGGSDVVNEMPWSVKHSGNSVSLPQEMLKAGEVSREYALGTSVVKSFHRMLIMSAKG